MTTLVHFRLDALHNNPGTVVDIEEWRATREDAKRASDFEQGPVIHTLRSPGDHYDKHIHSGVMFVLRERKR